MTIPQLPLDKGLPRCRPAFAGFGMRLGAFVIDVVALYFAGYTLEMGARAPLLELGESLPFLTTLAAFCYFWFGNGPVGGGQTLGKAILNIRTVDASGERLGWGASLRRTCLHLPIAFVAFVDLAAAAFDAPYGLAFQVRQLATLSASAILFTHAYTVFSHPRRQGWHDQWGGSFVASDPPGPAFREALADEDAEARIGASRRVTALFFALVTLLMAGRWGIGLFDRDVREQLAMADLVQREATPEGLRLVAVGLPPLDPPREPNGPQDPDDAVAGAGPAEATSAEDDPTTNRLGISRGDLTRSVFVHFAPERGVATRELADSAAFREGVARTIEVVDRAYAKLPLVVEKRRPAARKAILIAGDTFRFAAIPFRPKGMAVAVSSLPPGGEILFDWSEATEKSDAEGAPETSDTPTTSTMTMPAPTDAPE